MSSVTEQPHRAVLVETHSRHIISFVNWPINILTCIRKSRTSVLLTCQLCWSPWQNQKETLLQPQCLSHWPKRKQHFIIREMICILKILTPVIIIKTNITSLRSSIRSNKTQIPKPSCTNDNICLSKCKHPPEKFAIKITSPWYGNDSSETQDQQSLGNSVELNALYQDQPFFYHHDQICFAPTHMVTNPCHVNTIQLKAFQSRQSTLLILTWLK